MMIDRVGLSSALQGLEGVAGTVSRLSSVSEDIATISGEAVGRASFYRTAEIVHAEPDIRADRIAEVRARLADPTYFSATVLGGTADIILDQLFGS